MKDILSLRLSVVKYALPCVCLLLLSGCAVFQAQPKAPTLLKIAHLDGSILNYKGNEDPAVAFRAFANYRSPSMLPRPNLAMNAQVERELNAFLTKDRGCVTEMINRRAARHYELTEAFAVEGVPSELINLAGIESRFNPTALSPVGARGMWQFMKSTAKLYGLKVGNGHDERTDPVRSTVAAAKHLKDLFLAYNDWHLALAAYNAGPGRVDRAISQTGSTDYWTLVKKGKLAVETQRFVPRFIALSIIMQDPDKYGFEAPRALG